MRRRKTKIIAIISLGVLAAGLVAYAGYTKYLRVRKANSETVFYPKADSTTPKPSVEPETTTPTPAPPAPASSSASSSSTKIVITNPTSGATLTDGTQVTGHAPKGASSLYYRVKGGKSGQLALGPVPVDSSGNFTFMVGFTNEVKGGADQGELDIYEQAAGGAETNITSVLVNLAG